MILCPLYYVLFSKLVIIPSHSFYVTDTDRLIYLFNIPRDLPFLHKVFPFLCCSCYCCVCRVIDLSSFQGYLTTSPVLDICFFYKIIGSIIIFSYIMYCILMYSLSLHCSFMFHLLTPHDSLSCHK